MLISGSKFSIKHLNLALVVISGVLVFLAFNGGFFMKASSDQDRVRMGLPIHWRNLHPGLQHTLAGDLVLSNQFDSLVGMDSRGVIVPIGARSWSINDTYTKFTFKIDTTKKFSDGESLKAIDFKTSWEKSLALEPISSNNSLLDVLYKIKGFFEFGRTGTLSGVEVIGDDTLIVSFSSPFRMALDHLTGNRFAAFREIDGKYLGTGKYIINENDANSLTLVPQPYSNAKNSIDLIFVSPNKVAEMISRGEVDCVPYIQGTMVSSHFANDSTIQIVSGQEASHMALNINNLPGRFFHKRELRKALQALVWKRIGDGIFDSIRSPYFQFDAQVYMNGQLGRIEKEIVDLRIREGEKWIPDLIAAANSNPLLIYAHEGAKAFFDSIKDLGIRINENSQVVDQKTFLDTVYKDFRPDILIGAFSIANGDPDGIYHRLGKNGAILSPMSFSVSVSEMLEEGRKVLDPSKLDSYYGLVSEKILDDIPFVHLGFSKAVAILRKDRVKFNDLTLRRNEGHLEVFELK